MDSPNRFRHLLFVIALSTLGHSHGALQIDGYTDAKNDRFADSGAFVLNGFDLSGVGRSAGGFWATMVSSNVFVSANHHHPSNGSTLYFHPANDPSGSKNGAPLMRTQLSLPPVPRFCDTTVRPLHKPTLANS